MRRNSGRPELDKGECQASVTPQCDDDGVPLRWMHKVRLYPNRAQERLLDHALHVTRNLYNAALDQRKYVWASRKRGIAAKTQYTDLTALRGESLGDAAIYRELQDAVLHRLDLAYRAFFARCKRGETPGHPRFKSAARWNQLEFPHGDRALKFAAEQRSVRVPGIGFVKLRKGRKVPENFGRAFLVRKNGKWYAVLECRRDVEPMPKMRRLVGIDAGITSLIATSDGDFFANPRHGERNRARVARAQRALDAATRKDAHGRPCNVSDAKRKAKVLELARAKESEANARRDALHKRSRELVERYDGIAMEGLSLRRMTRSAKGTLEKPGTNLRAKSGLNRALLDTGLGPFGS